MAFPASAGAPFGPGLGGFVGGIAPRQVPQWHRMLTGVGHSADGIAGLGINTPAEGFLHAGTQRLRAGR